MAALRLVELQDQVADLVAAAPFLAGISVITDDGTTHDSIEAALTSQGLVVVIGPTTSFRIIDQGYSAAIGDATIDVEVWENPDLNPSGANKAPLDVITAAGAAILAHAPDPGETPFSLSTSAVELLASEPGLRGYALSVTKTVLFA